MVESSEREFVRAALEEAVVKGVRVRDVRRRVRRRLGSILLADCDWSESCGG